MTWAKGSEVIERLLATKEIETVTPSEQIATQLLGDADRHIVLAQVGTEDGLVPPDYVGALQLAYDAARKAAAALLEHQGLRARWPRRRC